MLHAESRFTIAAPPAAVWALIADTPSWPTWAGCDAASIEQEGPDDPMGVGMIRRFKTGRVQVREEITAFDAPRRVEYVLHEGLPLKDYVAEMILEPNGDGTELTWRSRFDVKIPLTGILFRKLMQLTLDRWGAGLKTYAEQQATPA